MESSSPAPSPMLPPAPPYWVSRQLPTPTPPTVAGAPTAAIQLCDNEAAATACWAHSVSVLGHTVVAGGSGRDGAGSAGAFVVWTVRVEPLGLGPALRLRKRYSEFAQFRAILVDTIPHARAAVPKLPPKAVLARFGTRFLEARRAGLEHFLTGILLNPEFSGSAVLKEFLLG